MQSKVPKPVFFLKRTDNYVHSYRHKNNKMLYSTVLLFGVVHENVRFDVVWYIYYK